MLRSSEGFSVIDPGIEPNESLAPTPVAGPCPDSDFCIRMGYCMSGCTSGPRAIDQQVSVPETDMPTPSVDCTISNKIL